MICTGCSFELSEAGLTTIQPVDCPSCGKTLQLPSQAQNSSLEIFWNYWIDLQQILTQPKAFFSHMPIRGGYVHPLAFALITHWFASSIAFLWSLLLGHSPLKFLQNWIQETTSFNSLNSLPLNLLGSQSRQQIIDWFFGVGPVILDPFVNLFGILISSIFIYAGARIFITLSVNNEPKEITYESIFRILCFGMSPSILSIVPVAGVILSKLGIFVITVIGLKTVYKIGTSRAITVYLFPKLLFLGIIGIGFLVLMIAFFRLFSFSF